MEIAQCIEIMKSLADSSRLLIINSLLEKAQYVEELAARLNLAASTVSFHLKKMEKAGLLKKKKDQYYMVFELNQDLFNKTLKEFISFANIEKYVQDERINTYRNKVIHTFFRNGKLEKLPAQHKKRWIILEELASRFSDKKIYNEAEVDNMISEVFDDYCTIRRYFIEEKIMTRKNGKYQLVKQDQGKVTGLRKSYIDSISK